MRELSPYVISGTTWRGILIPPKLDRETLIRPARELHARNPTTAFHFVDDAAQYEPFMMSTLHYPDATFPYPEEWANQHELAMVNRMLVSGGPRWQLLAMPGGFYLLDTGSRSTELVTFD